MKKFKEEDLILYLYNDGTPELRAAIDNAIADDDLELQDRLQVLKRSIGQLNKLKLKSPSKQSLKTILQYAKDNQRKK